MQFGGWDEYTISRMGMITLIRSTINKIVLFENIAIYEPTDVP